MVDIVSAAPAATLRITVRPNSAMHHGEGLLTLAVTVPLAVIIAAVFFFLGAWPVVPFVLLALAALGLAVYCVQRHAGDFERITVDDETLSVDRHDPQGDEHFEFNGYWVQIIRRQAAAGGCAYLALRSHGRELAVGHDLTDDERASVGRALLSRLARIRR